MTPTAPTVSDLIRLVAIVALAATFVIAPASAQFPWENDDCKPFAGCSLCEWDAGGSTCEVIDCTEDGSGHARMECTKKPPTGGPN